MPRPKEASLLKITRLPAIDGRTFICGDIHGSYSCVTQALEGLSFDKNKDRLICAGDLVDRGPANEACLDLLDKPWFFCCKGNHEQLMEDYFVGGYLGQWWGRNGGHWGQKYRDEDTDMARFVKKQLKLINELPYLITVEKKSGGVFHVLHAELPPFAPVDKSHRVDCQDGVITDEVLADPAAFTKAATVQTQDGDMITWGRYIFAALYKQNLDDRAVKKFARAAYLYKLGEVFNSKLSHIYSGHTIMTRPVTFIGQTNLDTMAYGSYPYKSAYNDGSPELWCGLTVTEPETGKFWLVNDREFKQVEPVVIQPYVPPANHSSIDLVEEHD